MIPNIRIRYSLRTGLVAITLFCVVIGSWQHCRDRAMEDVMTKAKTIACPDVVAPFLLYTSVSDNITVRETFHIWVAGAVIDLPFAREYPEPTPVIMVVQPRILFTRETDELLLLASPP